MMEIKKDIMANADYDVHIRLKVHHRAMIEDILKHLNKGANPEDTKFNKSDVMRLGIEELHESINIENQDNLIKEIKRFINEQIGYSKKVKNNIKKGEKAKYGLKDYKDVYRMEGAHKAILEYSNKLKLLIMNHKINKLKQINNRKINDSK